MLLNCIRLGSLSTKFSLPSFLASGLTKYVFMKVGFAVQLLNNTVLNLTCCTVADNGNYFKDVLQPLDS